MPFALQLFVDPVSVTAVRSLWEELASTGLSSMRDSGNRPHFSLALYRELIVPVCTSLLTSFAETHALFALSITSLAFFPGEQSVVFLAPIVSPSLLDLPRVAARCWPHSLRLLPHWALVTGVPPHLVSHMVAIGLGMSFPLHIRIEKIGVIEYPPVKHLFTFRLTGG